MSTTSPCPVTVVIPLYNGAQHITETLDSVARQSRPPAEVIVIDDGSSDEGPQLARDHPVGARVVDQKNSGVAVARNHGLSLAAQPWVAFLDQDDLWLPHRLESLIGWLGDHPDEQIVMTTENAFGTVDEVEGLAQAGRLVSDWAKARFPEPALEHVIAHPWPPGTGGVTHHDASSMLEGPISVTVSFMARADLLRMAGGFAPHALAMDDYWLLVNVAKLCPIARWDEPSVCYRVHLGATSRTTKLALPFLSSAIALRLGGGLVEPHQALAAPTPGPLHAHLLDEIQRSPEFQLPAVRRAVGHLSAMLWPGDWRRLQTKAVARLRLPWAGRLRRLFARSGR